MVLRFDIQKVYVTKSRHSFMTSLIFRLTRGYFNSVVLINADEHSRSTSKTYFNERHYFKYDCVKPLSHFTFYTIKYRSINQPDDKTINANTCTCTLLFVSISETRFLHSIFVSLVFESITGSRSRSIMVLVIDSNLRGFATVLANVRG